VRKGQRVVYRSTPGVLASFHLALVGTVDDNGEGVIVPAMVGHVSLDDGTQCIDVPLSELQEVPKEALNAH